MSTNYLGLDFQKPRKEFLADGPMAHICKKSGGIKGNVSYLCSECRSFEEIDKQINKLISELEEIRKEAKKKFKK